MACVAVENESVEKLQRFLNITADGKFGPVTYSTLKSYFLNHASDVMKSLPLAIEQTLDAYKELIRTQGVTPVLPYLQGVGFDERDVDAISDSLAWFGRCVAQSSQQQQQAAPVGPTTPTLPTVGITAIPTESNTWKWIIGALLAAGAVGLIYYMSKHRGEEAEEMSGTTCGCGR